MTPSGIEPTHKHTRHYISEGGKNPVNKPVRTSDQANRTIFSFLLIEILAFSDIIFQIKKLNGLCRPGIQKTTVDFQVAGCFYQER